MGGQCYGLAILLQGKSLVHVVAVVELALESFWMGVEERKSLSSHLGSSPGPSSL